MKRTLCAATALAVMLGATGLAFAQSDYGHDSQRGHQQQNQGGDRNGQASQNGHHPEWRKGQRMSQNDWQRGQRVDYRAHHLRAPPRGYEWREVDGNYVLAAAATGLIASIIANSQ
jgi:Ni/Co efflux regulator RcnB